MKNRPQFRELLTTTLDNLTSAVSMMNAAVDYTTNTEKLILESFINQTAALRNKFMRFHDALWRDTKWDE